MTTDHLDIDETGLDKLLGAAGKAAQQDNDDALTRDVRSLKTQVTNLAYGAAALVQRKLDRQEEINKEIAERQRQRELIRARAESMLSASAVVPVAGSADDLDEMPSLLGPAGPPTIPQPWVTPARPARPSATDWVRGFTAIQWVLAVIFALIGVLIAVRLNGIMDDLPLVLEQLVKGTFVLGFGLLGFGLGGLLGSLFDRRGNATE